MKKNKKEKTEEPFAVQVKIDELKMAQKELHEQAKVAHVKELLNIQERLVNLANQTKRSLNKAGALPISLKIKRTHLLGDFHGKFHPSKSNKGIKRSAP